jgi:hypothetical protein
MFSQAAGAATTTARYPTKVVLTAGKTVMSKFRRVSQSSSLDVVVGESSTGGSTVQRLRPGTVRVRITREWSNDTTFIDWYAGASAGTDGPQTMTVSVLGKRHSTISQLTMNDAVVVEWDAPVFDITQPTVPAVETLTLLATDWTYS